MLNWGMNNLVFSFGPEIEWRERENNPMGGDDDQQIDSADQAA